MDIRRMALHRLLWRLHFWGGLLGAPIVLFAALTGLVYVATPQIEAWRHAALDRVQALPRAPLPLDAQVAAVTGAFPEAPLRFVVPAFGPDDSTRVYLAPPPVHGHHGHGQPATAGHDHGLPSGSIAYVNPYTGEILGRHAEMDRFGTWAKKLHASALQGQAWRWVIELGASWMLVLFGSGLVLWWPRPRARGGPGWRALLPSMGRGRRSWREVHASVAVVLGLLMAVVLVTGLTWSRHAGDRFKAVQATLGQEAPRPPASLTPLAPAPGAQPLSWQDVHERLLSGAPEVALQITPPKGPQGVWRAENFDRSQPRKRFVRVLDPGSGAVLFASGWDRLPLMAKATAVGIPFHRGDYGWWNQALLVLVALGAVCSVVTGLAMWWLRRPVGRRLSAAPPWPALRDLPGWLWPVGLGLAWAMPVFGWSLLALALAESAGWAAGRLIQTRRAVASP